MEGKERTSRWYLCKEYSLRIQMGLGNVCIYICGLLKHIANVA